MRWEEDLRFHQLAMERDCGALAICSVQISTARDRAQLPEIPA